MGVVWTGSNGGVDWRLELERDRLLPGHLVAGRVTVAAHRVVDARALVVTLRGEERWRYDVTTSDGKTTTTSIHTGRQDLPPESVMVSGPLRLTVGETRSFDVSLAVPALGPATLDATEAAVSWMVEAKLDIEGDTDSRLEAPVRILQPMALLRAGVVHVGEFALYEGADATGSGVTGSITLDPVPLVGGAPFTGRLVIRPSGPMDVQEVRVELRVKVESTVGGARKETLVPWQAVVAGPGRLAGETAIVITGTIEDLALPTIELPHGKAGAQVHVILARRLARDPHLVREIAIATTREL